MLNVSEVILSPEFLTTIRVERKEGAWENGRYNTKDPIEIDMQGNLQPAGESDMVVTPEGAQIRGDIVAYTLQSLYMTQVQPGSNTAGVSDTVIFNGYRYQVIKVEDWSLYGYYKAICTRKEAA